jgi:predicted patatin/cPLA2 family phospholipase
VQRKRMDMAENAVAKSTRKLICMYTITTHECCHHSHPSDFLQWLQYGERFLVGWIVWSCIMQPKRMDVAENEVAKSTINFICVYTNTTTGKENAFRKTESH